MLLSITFGESSAMRCTLRHKGGAVFVGMITLLMGGCNSFKSSDLHCFQLTIHCHSADGGIFARVALDSLKHLKTPPFSTSKVLRTLFPLVFAKTPCGL